jgi:NADH dehydrogenase
VRALSRDANKLEALASLGAETFAGDMLDRAAMDRACQGVSQVVSTANNLLGKGAQSPNRIDALMYRTLGSAAKAASVSRWVHISAAIWRRQPDRLLPGQAPGQAIVRGGSTGRDPSECVLGHLDRVLFGNLERPAPVATIFGRGDRVVNYIAINDVVSFVLAILGDASVQNEIVDIGGPSEVNFIEFSEPIQRAMGVPPKRRHVPAPVLGIARYIARPFNEVASRFASLGYWATLSDRRFPEWRTSATRFGVEPVTIDQFAARYATSER